MNNNDPRKRRKKINHEKEEKESMQKKKKIMRKGISLLWSLSFVSLSLDRTRSREEERKRAHSLERAIEREREREREHARTSERASERVREQSRFVCRSGFACFGHEFWGVNKRQFGRERGRGREEVLGELTWLPYRWSICQFVFVWVSASPRLSNIPWPDTRTARFRNARREWGGKDDPKKPGFLSPSVRVLAFSALPMHLCPWPAPPTCEGKKETNNSALPSLRRTKASQLLTHRLQYSVKHNRQQHCWREAQSLSKAFVAPSLRNSNPCRVTHTNTRCQCRHNPGVWRAWNG